MQTLTDLVTEYTDATKDDTTGNEERGKRRIQQRYKSLVASYNYHYSEKKYTIKTVANQQAYDLPQTLNKIDSIQLANDDDKYTPTEIVSPIEWDNLQEFADETYADHAVHYHIRNGQIHMFPIPTTADMDINIAGHMKPTKLQYDDYSTGTVDVTNGNTAVSGTTTVWGANVHAGMFLIIDEQKYEIASVTNDTTLVLAEAYTGESASGIDYRIGDVPIIPEESTDVLWLYAVRDYYAYKEDQKSYQMYNAMMQEAEARFATINERIATPAVMKRRKKYAYNKNLFPSSIG